MTRTLIPLATVAATYALAEALAHHSWLTACLAAAVVAAGIVKLVPQSEM